jgi:hypothetical protein
MIAGRVGGRTTQSRTACAKQSDADRATIERLRDVIRGMTDEEAREALDRLLILTRKLERGDGARLDQAGGRVRLYAFAKSDRLTATDRFDLLKRLEG